MCFRRLGPNGIFLRLSSLRLAIFDPLSAGLSDGIVREKGHNFKTMPRNIPFPPPPIEVSPVELRRLQSKADAIELDAWSLIRGLLSRGEEFIEPETITEWLYEEGGMRQLARDLELRFIGSGIDRLVFVLDDNFVAKLAFQQVDSNFQEWEIWHRLGPERRRWLAKPYAISMEESVIIMERLEPLNRDTPGAKEGIVAVLEQEPWLKSTVLDLSWYNWGYRPGSDVPIVLDYGY